MLFFFVPGYLMLCLYAFSQVCLTPYAYVAVIYLELFCFVLFCFFFFRFSITMQEKLHLFFYSASGLFFLFSFLSFFLFFFFFSSKGTIIWSQCSSVPDGRKYTGWATFFKEFLETMGEIYLQGKSTAKTQAVCLQLRSPLLHFKVSPPHPAHFSVI